MFIKILIQGAQVSFLLASWSAINSPYSFEVEFCIPSFFSAMQSFPFAASYHLIISEMLSISPWQAYSFVIEFSQQLHSIFSSKVAFYFIRGTSCHFLLRSFHSTLSILSGGFVSCLHQVSFHPLKLGFYSSMFQPECCLNPFSIICFLSRSN